MTEREIEIAMRVANACALRASNMVREFATEFERRHDYRRLQRLAEEVELQTLIAAREAVREIAGLPIWDGDGRS